jgi:hypothetical protein
MIQTLSRRINGEKAVLAITLVMFLLFAVLLVMEDIRSAAGAVVLLGLVLWIMGKTDLWYGLKLLIGVLRALWRLTVVATPVSFPQR